MQKSFVNVQPSLVVDNQSSELAQPGQRALDHPSVLAQFLTALHVASGYPRSDASLSQCASTPLEVVPFVSVQLGWAFSSSSVDSSGLLYGFDSINHIGKSVAIMHVGRSADYRERYSLGV